MDVLLGRDAATVSPRRSRRFDFILRYVSIA